MTALADVRLAMMPLAPKMPLTMPLAPTMPLPPMVPEDWRQTRERLRALFTQEEEPTGGIR